MSDPEPTRQETVEENIDNVMDEYGKDGLLRMICECVKDISVSLAMLVDKSAT